MRVKWGLRNSTEMSEVGFGRRGFGAQSTSAQPVQQDLFMCFSKCETWLSIGTRQHTKKGASKLFSLRVDTIIG